MSVGATSLTRGLCAQFISGFLPFGLSFGTIGKRSLSAKAGFDQRRCEVLTPEQAQQQYLKDELQDERLRKDNELSFWVPMIIMAMGILFGLVSEVFHWRPF